MIAHPWVPISSKLTQVVNLMPFLNYLAGSKSVSTRLIWIRWQIQLWKLPLRRAAKSYFCEQFSYISINRHPAWFFRHIANYNLHSEEVLQKIAVRLEKASAGDGIKISSNKDKILINTIKPRLSANICMNGKNAGRSGPIKIPCIHTNQRQDRTSVKQVKFRLAQAHSTLTRIAIHSSMDKQSHQFSYKD